MQLDQQPAGSEQRELLAAEVFALPRVQEHPSLLSLPGARALWLTDSSGAHADAFMAGTEFAHLHPDADQSLHVMLPPRLVEEAIQAGWAEQHPAARRGLIHANAVMLYAPRDNDERTVVASLVKASHAYASGDGEDAEAPGPASPQ